jgi:hypothetical protein
MISVHTVNRFPLTYMYIKHYLLIVIEFFSELKVSCGLSNNNQLLINSILLLSTQPKLSLQYKIINSSNRFIVCTEIMIILGMVQFTIRGGRLRYKRYDAHFLKKSSIELPFSSFGDHLINIL